MTDNETGSEIGLGRSLDLLDCWMAAVCVEADGTETYWLIDPDPHGPPGCACARCAPHDWLGTHDVQHCNQCRHVHDDQEAPR